MRSRRCRGRKPAPSPAALARPRRAWGEAHQGSAPLAQLFRRTSSSATRPNARKSSRRSRMMALTISRFRRSNLPWLDDVVRAKRPKRLPIVLTRDEVRAVITELHGTPRLMATLLYGSGLRLLECCRLRVQDVDFGMNQIIVRDGKGAKDRVTVLPAVVKGALAQHLHWVKRQHEADLTRG